MNYSSYKYVLLSCLISTAAVSGTAQSVVEKTRLADQSIVIRNKQIGRMDRNMMVGMDVKFDSLSLPSNLRLVFTPAIRNGDREVRLRPFIVNGRRQDISFKRYAHKQYAPDALVVRRRNRTAQTLQYNEVVPYEEWMENANVVILEDLCGCGDRLNQNEVLIKRLRRPHVAYVRPAAEARKERQEEGRAFIDFPVDKTVLHPDYRNNPAELDKIIRTINLVKEDKNVTITSISIHGYASPESPYEHNAYLAENRARTLKDYVRRLVNLDDHIFTVKSTPEDWEGLKEYVENTNLKNKQEILNIINTPDLGPDPREWRIKLNYPEDYKFLLEHCYPSLRHSDYVVNYRVRPFSADEARQLLNTKPQQLSLEEMFLVAQTCEPGSEEFNKVFAIAVRMYPDDPVANLNAACAEIESGRLEAAEQYLLKAGSTPHATHARAMIALKRGNEAEAMKLFRQAADGGVKEARQNLELYQH